MVIFHSYVSLPEGIDHEKIINSSNIGWMSTGILTIFSAPGDHSDKTCHGQNLGKLPSYWRTIDVYLCMHIYIYIYSSIGVPFVGWITSPYLHPKKKHVLVKRWPAIVSCNLVELGLILFQGEFYACFRSTDDNFAADFVNIWISDCNKWC